jgi:branched-chain amino acid transport system ATP-binding protein
MADTSVSSPPRRATESTEPSDALEAVNVEVTYNRVAIAIQGVSISVPAGSIVAILGSNGAGKTTLLRAITGFLPGDFAAISDGEVRYGGHVLNDLQPHRIARRGIALVPERDKVFTTLTVEENLRCGHRPGGRKGNVGTMELIEELFPTLIGHRRQMGGYLSGGERQMLAIAQALLLEPRVLLADELSLGIAPALVIRLMDAMRRINTERGTSIVLVEQNAPAALAVADYAYIMETGRIVLDGTPARLMEHEDVKEFYLGLGAEDAEKSYADVKQYRRKRRWWG